jgi:Ni/Co efflux regulator RcnB
MKLQKIFAATVSAATFLALAGAAQAQSIDLRTGYYAPRGAYGADPCACGAASSQDERWAYYEQHSSGAYAPPPQYAPPPAYVGPQSYAPNAAYYPPAPAAGPSNYYPSYYDQYTPGQSTWRPETLLPPNLRGYRINGYIKGLPRPKYGYAWYHIGNDYVLASTETGVIVTIMNFPN